MHFKEFHLVHLALSARVFVEMKNITSFAFRR